MAAEINFMVGGEAGQGVQTIGFVLAKVMARTGLHVFADQDYESRVRGGHNFYRVRASNTEVQALSEKIDVLIALDQATVELHFTEVKSDGITIFDRDKIEVKGKKHAQLGIPLEKLAMETTSNKLMTNSVAIGAAIAIAGGNFELLAQVLREHFTHLGKQLAEDNMKAAKAGYDHARQEQAPNSIHAIKPPSKKSKRMLLNGNEAIALGAMVAGCKFVSAYPMTPASSIMEYIADKGRQFDVVVIQPEDEIAAINMIIGAAFTGVRAMTATSGGGFSLMVEGLSLAGITETPIVAILAQRPGPAVGLPTRTEQGELGFVLHAGHGEFPRAVLAPISIEDAFYSAVKAFNIADRYQIPVIMLTDQHLASSYQTVQRFNLKKVSIDRGLILSKKEASGLKDYKRHKLTRSGISPRAIPLQGTALVVTDSDEHDEEGHMIEDGRMREKMVLKRLRKLEGLRDGITKPRLSGEPDAEITLIGWGSTYGAIVEAASILSRQGIITNVMQMSDLWPFPAQAVTSILNKAGKSVVVENNATGQLATLIRAQTGIKVDATIPKFDGRPFSPGYIVKELKKGVV